MAVKDFLVFLFRRTRVQRGLWIPKALGGEIARRWKDAAVQVLTGISRAMTVSECFEACREFNPGVDRLAIGAVVELEELLRLHAKERVSRLTHMSVYVALKPTRRQCAQPLYSGPNLRQA